MTCIIVDDGLFGAAVDDGMVTAVARSGGELSARVEGVASVLREVSREVSGRYQQRFVMWLDDTTNFQIFSVWCGVDCCLSLWPPRWSRERLKYLMLVSFGEGEDFVGDLVLQGYRFAFVDISSFRTALAAVLRTPACGVIMMELFGYFAGEAGDGR